MVESLIELRDDISAAGGALNILHGDDTTIEKIITENNITTVAFNRDYTPFAKARDSKIITLCEKKGVKVITSHDYLLLDEHSIDAKPYKIFTPFYNKYLKTEIREPSDKKVKISNIMIESVTQFDPSNLIGADRLIINPGRKAALGILKSIISGKFTNYENDKDTLAVGNTNLSAHNKFGNISIREVYTTMKKGKCEGLIRQLFWRDFYYNLMNSDPYALAGNYNSSYKQKWANLNNPAIAKHFEAWKQGKTGFSVVDAGMRELSQTGMMHNRARLICADFLVKLLRIDWRLGEKHFAQHLIDYDPTQNNYNWQWVAGTGPFSQPKYRVFNPYKQAADHDPKGEYVRKWVPEFASEEYPKPIVDYAEAKKEYLRSL